MEQKKTAVTDIIENITKWINSDDIPDNAKSALTTCCLYAKSKLPQEREQMEDMYRVGFTDSLTLSLYTAQTRFDQNYTQQHGTETK